MIKIGREGGNRETELIYYHYSYIKGHFYNNMTDEELYTN